MLRRVDALWRTGWQPAELARHVRRSTTAPAAKLVLHTIAADHTDRELETLDPRWIAQLDQLDLPREGSRNGWLRPWTRSQRIEWTGAIVIVIDLLQCLASTAPIPVTIPPPGHADNSRIDLTTPVDDPVLQRVRALLAQAESTNFEAEAETFTAKAQELMTRHAIDEALLDARRRHHDAPITLRIPIDDPYADAKSTLAHAVAEQSRCRSVFDPRHSMSSIVGLARDVAVAEMLFTSLLVQASSAMRAASADAPAGAHSRSRGFRSAFWVAYAVRVGQRLGEINEHLVTEADIESGGALLPVLARRSAEIDRAVDEMFGALKFSRHSGSYDRAGWASGTAAANAAHLNAGALSASTQ
jgi:hypothetical protein